MKKGEQRKQELLKIAYDLFLSEGYENTSVDTIIEKAGIAKGTYYYYFESKEEMLEEVCMMMIDGETEKAMQIVNADIPIPQKIIGIISSFRPEQKEKTITDTLNSSENILMHDKVNKRIIEVVAPILTKVAEQGIEEGVLSCDNVYERVRMLLIVSNTLFDDYKVTERDVDVFIDMIEKLLGAKPGTMDIIKQLINGK
ncbi:MAG: TetR/AcrR family transcriptional regulator [Lachnospiraceae bacterium]|nr:TetR/AcrR family transcriptional regulator [Lachnospiraceae bacterium]